MLWFPVARDLTRYLLAGCTLALVAACAMPQYADTRGEASDPFSPAAIQLIDNTHWTLQSWHDNNGSSHALPAAPVTLDLSTATGVRQASGSTGCNRYNGTYLLKNGMISFGPLATTRRACNDGGFEAAYVKALAQLVNAGAQLRGTQQQLYLITGDGATLSFAPSAP
jgi:heat shock protein HslJ